MSRFANDLKAALSIGLENDSSDTTDATDVIDVAAVEAATGNAEGGDTAAVTVTQDAGAAADADGTVVTVTPEEGEEVTVVIDADEVIVDNSDSLEEAIADTAAEEDELDDEAAKVEVLQDAAQGLESILNVLSDAQQRGGLTRETAQMAHLALESIAKEWGGTSGDLMYSVESFGGSSTRLDATRLSMESIKEQLQKVWRAIKNALIAMKDKVIAFFKSIFVASERMLARAKKLETVNLQGSPKNTKIAIKGYAKKIADGTTIRLDPVKGLAVLKEAVDGAVIVEKNVAASLGGVEAAIAQLAAGSLKADQVKPDSLNLPKPAGFVERGGQLFTPNMPGNKQFAVVSKKIGNFSIFWIATKDNPVNISEDAEIPTFSVERIRATGKAVADLHASITAANNSAKAAADSAKKMKDLMPKEGLDDASKTALRELMSVYRSRAAMLGSLTAKVASHAVTVASVYLKLAEKSAAQWQGKSKELTA